MGEREMSQNKSLQSKMPLAMGLAFVAFTTQFGGLSSAASDVYKRQQLRYLVSDPAGSDTGIVCTVFLVWNALRIQTQNLRLQKLFRQSLRKNKTGYVQSL